MENGSSPIESTVQPGETTFSHNFIMVMRIRGDFSEDQLRSALDRLRKRHARLISAAEMYNPDCSHFPLRVLTSCAETDWVGVAKTELRRRFEGRSGPYARFVLLRAGGHSDLVGTFEHGASDGMTGVFVLRDILRLLADPALELPADPNPANMAILIPKSVKENPAIKMRLGLMAAMFRITGFFGRLHNRLFPLNQEAKTSPAFIAGDSLPLSLRFCILTTSLSAAQTTALVRRCKAEQTSVHAAVCTAWLRAFADSLKDRKSWVRSVSSPVNLRERLSQPIEETAGMFMSGTETRVNCSPERDFWQIAREIKKRLIQDSSDEKVFLRPLMFSSFFTTLKRDEIEAVIGKFFNRPVNYDFSITNLGRLDIPVNIGSLKVEAFHNLVNSSEYERTVGVNTLGDQMSFTYTFRESNMDPDGGKRLMNAAMEQLVIAVNQEAVNF